MSLTEMSFFGGIMIAVIIIIRALALHRLPKRVFCTLWGLAALRLLIPFSVPSPLRVQTPPEPVEIVEKVMPVRPAAVTLDTAAPAYVSVDVGRTQGLQIPVRLIVWGTGTALCTAFFAASYVWGRRKFACSEPVEQASAWLAEHLLKRPLTVRQCREVSAPLTYGILRPVILTPVGLDWSDTEQTAYVLEHEFVHVQRFDAAAKLVLTAAVCVHWFNPLAWAMYVLANRDIELSCDETVVRRFGLGKRSAYALTLIGMEEQKGRFSPLASGFSKNAIEERIRAIMKIKKTSMLAVLLAAVLVCMVSVGFAVSAESKTEDLREYLKKMELPSPEFNKKESQRLFSLWFAGYEDMTVAAYQEKMWTERDTPEDIELIERYAKSLGGATYRYFDDQKANEALDAFREYYCNVYEPLTAERWKRREFSGHGHHDGILNYLPTDPSTPAMNAHLEYTFVMDILDAEKLTVGEYEKAKQNVKTVMTALLWERTREELKDSAYMETLVEQEIKNLEDRLSTGSLQVLITDYVFRPIEEESEEDTELYRQFSEDVGQHWDELLAPYLPFGLTYKFDDPDHDGNGLKMYYQGREVQGITDEQKNIWITEHTGNSFAPNAVELYAVYENGKLAGLRTATAAEQAEWNAIRQRNADTRPNPLEEHQLYEEQREFPNGTAKDYVSFLE
ncbi:MAG: M56 family metallopeptidase, partial [Oscillospiraceae bacterium]|nr:M56 family metallopeptidase [Oscillospiraceae bacterium]